VLERDTSISSIEPRLQTHPFDIDTFQARDVPKIETVYQVVLGIIETNEIPAGVHVRRYLPAFRISPECLPPPAGTAPFDANDDRSDFGHCRWITLQLGKVDCEQRSHPFFSISQGVSSKPEFWLCARKLYRRGSRSIKCECWISA